MIQKNKIGIIGCGWLGLPLAKLLLKKKYSIKGSTTSKEKLQILQNHKINPYLIEIKENEIKGDVDSFMLGLDILIINIPPKMKSNPNSKYSKKVESLNSFIKSKSINKILFISSTSVYGSNQGEVDSNTVPLPNSENGLEILKSEKILNKNKNCTLIRFGGLIGNNRHPVYSLSKKNKVLNPEAPINLIHLEDCIQIIYSIIKKDKWGETYLGVSPYHPKRINYYNKKCRELGLKEIVFENNTLTNKEITDYKIKTELNYDFKHPKL